MKILSAIFILAISVFFALYFILPAQNFSENENRVLKTLPKFSFEDLFSGRYTQEFEEFLSDQFAFRDFFVSTKATAEVLSGKNENNGVFIGKDEYLIAKFDKVDWKQMDKNISYVNNYANKLQAKLYLCLIPDSVEVVKDKLPVFAQNKNQKEILDYIRKNLNEKVIFIDSYSALVGNEDIYYRLDHHLTSKGSYLVYKQLCSAMQLDINDDFNITKVSDSFNGTQYSKSGIRFFAPDEIYAYRFAGDENITVDIFDDSSVMQGMYNDEFLYKKDKYSYFLGGNHALMKINTNNQNQEGNLFIKDSYANSVMPIFAKNAGDIHAADLRFFKGNTLEYTAQNDISNVIILYGLSNFIIEKNIVFLNNY